MRFLVIYPANNEAGGIFNATISHAAGLQAAGQEVTLLTGSRKMKEIAAGFGVTSIFCKAIAKKYHWLWNRDLQNQIASLRHKKFHAVIHQKAKSWLLGQIMFRQSPQFVVFHNIKLGSRRLFRNWLALSTMHYKELQKADRANRNIQRIKNTTLLTSNRVIPPDPSLITKEKLVIGSLAEIRHKKGFDLLIRAFANLVNRGPVNNRGLVDREMNIELILGGSGDKRDLVKLSQELGVSDRISFPGWFDNPWSFYEQIDIYCLPSRNEPFGLVVLEAMLAGLPMVASRTNGPLDILEHNKTGWLFPIEDVAALEKTLFECLDNRKKLLTVAQNGQQHILDNYSLEAVGHSIVEAVKKGQ